MQSNRYAVRVISEGPLKKALGGDVLKDNINYIVGKYSDMIYRTALAYLGSPTDAEDIVSEVLIKYITADNDGHEFSGEEHIKAWLLRVTINICKDILKSARVKSTTSLDLSPETESELRLAETSETRLDIEAALDSIPSDYRIVLYLYYYQEFSTKEIARLLDVPKNTVVSRLSRARKALRKKLAGYGAAKKGVTNNYA